MKVGICICVCNHNPFPKYLKPRKPPNYRHGHRLTVGNYRPFCNQWYVVCARQAVTHQGTWEDTLIPKPGPSWCVLQESNHRYKRCCTYHPEIMSWRQLGLHNSFPKNFRQKKCETEVALFTYFRWKSCWVCSLWVTELTHEEWPKSNSRNNAPVNLMCNL